MATNLEASPMRYRAPDDGYAKGWYRVAESIDVTADAMLPVRYFGEQLIVYRNADGSAQVADAFCPHLGAHLASHDGAIVGGKITCPFHKWTFDGATGRCIDIPYTKVMVPASVKLTLYPTRETDDMVLMWYHPQGAEPDYEPYSWRATSAEPWIHYRSETRISTCPYRDLFENLFDTAHVQQLHNAPFLPKIKVMQRVPYGIHAEFATPDEPTPYDVRQLSNEFSGISLMSQVVSGDAFGFLQSVSATPIDEEKFEQVSRLYIRDMGSPELNAEIGERYAENTNFETDKDFRVLDFKKHLSRPQLCAGDGPIMKWRQYLEEFYV